MKLAQALEQLAQTTRFDHVSQSIIEQQSDVIRQAIATNDAAMLQRQMSSAESYAHETLVVQ